MLIAIWIISKRSVKRLQLQIFEIFFVTFFDYENKTSECAIYLLYSKRRKFYTKLSVPFKIGGQIEMWIPTVVRSR